MPSEEMTYRRSMEDKVDLILKQTTEHNHRMTKIERNMLVVGTATAVVIMLKLPELIPLLRIL